VIDLQGFCNVVFGWDMHDKVYPEFSNQTTGWLLDSDVLVGFSDIIAKIDPSTYRRIPWEKDTAFFLLDFYDPYTGNPLGWCPRSLLKRVCGQLAEKGMKAYAGVEFEFYNFKGNLMTGIKTLKKHLNPC
jgi:glutamine synthetase